MQSSSSSHTGEVKVVAAEGEEKPKPQWAEDRPVCRPKARSTPKQIRMKIHIHIQSKNNKGKYNHSKYCYAILYSGLLKSQILG